MNAEQTAAYLAAGGREWLVEVLVDGRRVEEGSVFAMSRREALDKVRRETPSVALTYEADPASIGYRVREYRP